MHSFFRLLLWLSITVLSFQGSAAMAVGQLDAPAHGTMVMSAHEQHEAIKHTDEGHCGNADSKAQPSHGKCAMCAVCCISAAAPPALLPEVGALPGDSSLHAIAPAAMTSFFPSGLERPPRHSFV